MGEAESEASTSKQTKPILSKVVEVESQSSTSKWLKSTVPEVVEMESQPSTTKHSKTTVTKVKPSITSWDKSKDMNWSLTNREITHEPSTAPDTGLGQSGVVMIGLVEYSDIPSGLKLYFDNLFTSLQLLEELCRRNLGGTETRRENINQ